MNYQLIHRPHRASPPLEPPSTNPANQIAKQLTGRDYVSWSALSTFRQCPLKHRFRYIDGLPEETVASSLVFGTGIHAAVEQHFQAMLSGDQQPDLDQLMFAYRSAWLPHEPDQIHFGSSETRASLDGLASKMLTAFLASPAASVSGRVLGVEEEIRGMLVEGVPDLYGRVDLLTEDHDRLTITDIKTSRGKWSAEQVEDSGEQLLLYSKLASEIAPGKQVQTRFLVLTKTEDQGAGRRGARAAERARESDEDSRGHGAGVAGRSVGRVLPGTEPDELRFMRLSGGVSGVGGVRIGGTGWETTRAAFF